ncbi:transketolase [endosymbiont of Acanthamoeba sp. UWC8]|uniref:transketolase n=1 Tax=endosymbiont of Acanthamoeba sp. UWC8 TaxID=86106 RepID=UPI0004D122B7|nr:transketolase [endosymbiont of Acanthamoeba sp. UWC8]AIF80724.1 transketolase [endosymbiont of Acanthamoeba sp. UWC8]
MGSSLGDFNLSLAIRFLSMDMVEQAKSGHPGMPMGMADVATVLYKYFLKFNPKDPAWADRDRFILSAGHGSALLYSLLYLNGYEDINVEQLKNFRKLGSKTAGHPEYHLAKGIETSTGPLGQGLANGVGMALAERMLNAEFGDELVSHKTYVIVGDGCLAEGISQEAISIAGHLRLKNIIVLFDDNGITIDGSTNLSTSDNHLKRFEASNWNVKQIDGHNYDQIRQALEIAQTSDKPMFIACKTKIGFGSPTKEGKSSVHGSPLGAEEIAAIREKFNWQSPPFVIPERILNEWRSIAARNLDEYNRWNKEFNNNNKKDKLKSYLSGEIPLSFKQGSEAIKRKLCIEANTDEPSRKSSERIVELMAEHIENIRGGSADLTPSNNTKARNQSSVTPGDYSGRYIHYGIREHAMAAMMNGIVLHGGFIPYGGTFLAFSDYCRPAIRLSALMALRVIYVMTHDSIGLGEDGPTHQPVEHLAALRAIPNLLVFRPCDVIETLECWDIALNQQGTPSVLALSRQNLPQLRKEYFKENHSALGAYVIKKEENELKVTIFASGSEVSLALVVAGKLEEAGNGTRVISVPCMDLFKMQDKEYQVSLTCNNSLKVAIEAGVEQGWERLIGAHGIFIGMESFGESGTAAELFKHFGFDPENILNKITPYLKK